MNLKEIRKQLVTLSGRFDLWNDDGSDNGADFFIRAGQRYAENLMHFDKAESFLEIAVQDKNVLLLPRARAIKKITMRMENGTESELPRCSYIQARKFLASQNELNDRPSHYFVLRSRGNDEETPQWITKVENISEADVVNTGFLNASGIVLVPAFSASSEFIVHIQGVFREPFLAEETDENYWTLEWPQLLLYAALREIEVTYRNTQGIRDWDTAIAALTITLEHDHVLDESHDVDQMLG